MQSCVVSRNVLASYTNLIGQNANAYLLFYRRRSQDPLGGVSYRKVEEASAQKASAEQENEPQRHEKVDDQQLPTPPSETVSVSSSPSHQPVALDNDWARLSTLPETSDHDNAFGSPLTSSAMGYNFPDPANHASPSSSVGVEADAEDPLDDMDDSWSSAVPSGLASPISSVSDLTIPD